MQPNFVFSSRTFRAALAALFAIALLQGVSAQPASKGGAAPFVQITPAPTTTPSPFHSNKPAAGATRTSTPAPSPTPTTTPNPAFRRTRPVRDGAGAAQNATRPAAGDRNANNTGQPQRNPRGAGRGGAAAGATASPLVDAINAIIVDVQRAAKDTLPQDALFPPGTKCLSADLTSTGSLIIKLSGDQLDRPITPEDPKKIEEAFAPALAATTMPAGTRTRIVVGADPIEKWITSPALIKERQGQRKVAARALAKPVVQRTSYAGPARTGGLEGRNLLVAPSHGWYWDSNSKKWEYQRPRMFTTVEDLFPQSYMNPFIIPMLENAGAVVWSARERDTQRAEIIVDNDAQNAGSELLKQGAWTALDGAKGWRGGVPSALGPMDEPFTFGTVAAASAVGAEDKSTTVTTLTYVPYFAKTGRYAVYVSWAMGKYHSPSVPVVVKHRGGETKFRVNQQVAGNTWVILGFFEFQQGLDPAEGSVTIFATGAEPSAEATRDGKPTLVTADAVRFGGGMGTAAPDGIVSGHPRYTESARYWTQYAGAPAKLVFHRSKSNRPGATPFEYNNDITSRPEWGNYINGAPNGPNGTLDEPGLGVPIDAQLHFHTDAGVTTSGLVGTLAIYRLEDDREPAQVTYPDGRPRQLSRDLSGLVQDEICRTIRADYTSTWVRRALGQGRIAYGEARRPNAPTLLLELLSHQNFNDMKYGVDPRFRKDVARAIYKGYLRFIAYSNGFEPIIQPLEPAGIAAHAVGASTAEINVVPREDDLEPSAKPTAWIIYRSTDGIGFDNGEVTSVPRLTVTGLAPDKTYYFRATQANAGGESLPGSVVAVRIGAPGAKKLLLVDGFDRICAPQVVDRKDFAGFVSEIDPGVGYHIAHGFVGAQFDHDPRSQFVTNDEPGWGASARNFENTTLRGNTFDHIVAHANALEGTGYAIDSATASAYEAGAAAGTYAAIDWIAGFQRTTLPPEGVNRIGAPDRMKPQFAVLSAASVKRLRQHVASGGGLLLSGAHVVSDLLENPVAADAESLRAFAGDVLGLGGLSKSYPRINMAIAPNARVSAVNEVSRSLVLPRNTTVRFGADLDGDVMPVARPEAMQTLEGGAVSLVYADSGLIAAATKGKVLTMAFPIETVSPEKTRAVVLKAAVKQVIE